MKTFRYGFLAILLFMSSLIFGQQAAVAGEDECTIGVASGKATSDGRPMVWKSRDNSGAPDNEVKYNTSFRYKFLSISTVGSTYAWMGLNEHGFAIVNALAADLPKGTSGPSNGAFMRDVLGNCKTLAEFRHYLDSTNRTGRTTRANFGVIDSTGEAAIFETSGDDYQEYNAADAPHGYVVRTNFSMTGGGSSGIERYNRSQDLMTTFYSGDSLNVKSILRYQMRDFSDFDSRPVSVPYRQSWGPGIPYGYINTSKSICRNSTVSAVVVQGVSEGEPGALSTFWAILGQPAAAVVVPYWPVGSVPSEADGETTAPLCDVARQIRSQLFDFSGGAEYINSFKLRDGKGAGLWSCTFPFEDSVLRVATRFVDSLRVLKTVPVSLMQHQEKELASRVLHRLQYCRFSLLSDVEKQADPAGFSLFPNPASRFLKIRYTLVQKEKVRIELFAWDGRKVALLYDGWQPPGKYLLYRQLPASFSSGIYFLMFRQGEHLRWEKIWVDKR